MKNHAWVILFLLAIAVLLGLTMYWSVAKNTNPSPIDDGITDDSENPNEDPIVTNDNIKVFTPQPNELMISTFTVLGEAKGTWYFEASFPVEVTDSNGQVLGTGIAQAQSDWMTENFVPFVAPISFTEPTTATGTLILHKDNPSGLPEYDDELRIPVSFQQPAREVKLYYYDENKDKDENGNIICSEQGLVPVTRTIPSTITPIRDTIDLLLKGDLTTAERGQGITTQYPLSGLELDGVNLSYGKLILAFKDPGNATTGGSCRVTVLWKQIEATALQFNTVETVEFTPDTLFQP